MRAFLDRFVGNLSPSALMVSTLFWSWFDLVPFSPLLAVSAGAKANPLVLAVSLLFGALALAACALEKHVRAASLKPRFFTLAAFGFGSAGTLLVYAGAAIASDALALAGAVLTGLFQGFGAALVGSLVTCQGKTNALIHIAACLPFNIVFVLLGMFLRPGAAVVLCAVLPPAAALGFKVFLERGHNAQNLARVSNAPAPAPRRQGALNRKPSLAACIGLLLVVTAAFGFVNCRVMFFDAGSMPSAYADYISLVIRAVVAVWVFSAYVFRSRQPYPFLVTAVLLMAAGLFALWFTAAAQPVARLASYSLFYAGYAVFDLLVWALIVIMHHGSHLPLQQFLCGAYALDEMGNALGTFAGLAVPNSVLAPTFGMAGAVLLLLAFAALNQRDAISTGLHVAVVDDVADTGQPLPDQPLSPAAPGVPSAASASRPMPAIPVSPAAPAPLASQPVAATVAARYFLTDRESVVLGLLLAGRSAPYIADELGVSLNTVKTHVRHIYAKLDVHNRQELLDLIASPDVVTFG